MSFSTGFIVEQGPAEVTAAVTDVRAWWTGEIEGSAEAPGDVFSYRYEDKHFSRHTVGELVPGHKVVWHVTEAHLPFASDPAEWVGTDIVFEVTAGEDGTELRFTHVGLDPQFECFTDCSNAWGFYVKGNLRRLITTGSAAG